ncbi:MAG TPA: MFS transporter [Pseudonocardiaceae bacterium]|jgi:EmrB/QacA subfamily drug resistance transporter|nr:MFS transporter [Pseudonocardiaceae bacterium]
MGDFGHRRRLLVLAVCCTSLLIAGLDVTAVNVALPAVGRDLHAPVSGLQWTIDGYTLAVAGFLMLAGSTADRIGRRRVFRTGLALFTGGSLACSLAPSLPWLVGFRVVQGLGASMLNPVALSILTTTFTDPRERTRAIGVWSGTIGLSLALGPVVGGLLVSAAGWRSVFWINLPVGVAAIALTGLLVPESKAPTARRPDPVGQVLVVTALGSITGAIIEGSRRGYANPLIIGLLGLGVVAVAALLGHESRRDQPLIDLTFFRSIPFAGATVAAVAAFVALSGFLFLNTLYLQDVRGFSALHAGLLTVPMAAATAIAAPISGRLTARYGARPPLVAAGLLVAGSAVLFTSLTPTTALPVLLVAYLLFGTGFGLVNTPITNTAVTGMPRAQAGVSAAIASTGRQIGNSLGVAVLGSLVTAHLTGGGFTVASQVGWWVLAGCGVLVAALGVLTTTRRATASATRIAARFPSVPAESVRAVSHRWSGLTMLEAARKVNR